MCKEKLHKYKNILQTIARYVIEFQITKSELKPIHKIKKFVEFCFVIATCKRTKKI
jgi:hypothetical protein